MGLFENFPYSNFHRANLDWVLFTVKSLAAEWVTVKEEFTDIKADFEELETFVTNYFDNLDVSEEVRAIIDSMATDGSLRAIMEPYINDLAGNVSSLSSEVDLLSSRMDAFSSLTEGSTTGDAELIDARIGGNGVTYPSAGDAIRAQYNINHRAIYRDDNSQVLNIMQSVDWEQGGFRSSDGTELMAATRIRTKGYLPTSAEWFLTNNADYGVYIFCYDSGGGYLGQWSSDYTITADGSGFPEGKVCVGDIYRLYPGTRVRLTIYPRGSAANPTPSTASTFTLSSSVARWGQPETVRVCQYNAGHMNFGGSPGGLTPTLAETKVANYHEFLGTYKPDFVCMQEYSDVIDSAATYHMADIFTPLYKFHSNEWREAIIYTDHDLYRNYDSYLHTSGDLPSWVVYSDCHINGKIVRIVSGVMSVGTTVAEKKRAIDKLCNTILVNSQNAIVCMDTNVASKEEADEIKAYFETYGLSCGNWDYFGYKDTYNLASSQYHSIDNIMVKGDLVIRSFIVPDVYADLSSDHFPVMADIAVL